MLKADDSDASTVSAAKKAKGNEKEVATNARSLTGKHSENDDEVHVPKETTHRLRGKQTGHDGNRAAVEMATDDAQSDELFPTSRRPADEARAPRPTSREAAIVSQHVAQRGAIDTNQMAIIPRYHPDWRVAHDITESLRQSMERQNAQQQLFQMQQRAAFDTEFALMLASGVTTASVSFPPLNAGPFASVAAWNRMHPPDPRIISLGQAGILDHHLYSSLQWPMQFQSITGQIPSALQAPALRNMADFGMQGLLQLAATPAWPQLLAPPLVNPPPAASYPLPAQAPPDAARAEHRRIQPPANNNVLLLAIPDDRGKLNDQQLFLRHQIEVFRASESDILTHTRAKNRPIVLGQVGIRCRHCSHLTVGRRRKASTYFPSALMGIYQAAHNLSVEHLQGGACPALPPDVRQKLIRLGEKKQGGASLAGKLYWADAAMRLGLVDTKDGIRFEEDVAIE